MCCAGGTPLLLLLLLLLVLVAVKTGKSPGSLPDRMFFLAPSCRVWVKGGMYVLIVCGARGCTCCMRCMCSRGVHAVSMRVEGISSGCLCSVLAPMRLFVACTSMSSCQQFPHAGRLFHAVPCHAMPGHAVWPGWFNGWL